MPQNHCASWQKKKSHFPVIRYRYEVQEAIRDVLYRHPQTTLWWWKRSSNQIRVRRRNRISSQNWNRRLDPVLTKYKQTTGHTSGTRHQTVPGRRGRNRTPTPETTKETQPTTCQESTDSQEVRKELKELQPKNGDTEPVVAHEDLRYRTHSGRLSIRPARFGDFVQRWPLA